VPAVIREVSDDKLLELALIENIQRQELNPIEEAQAYSQLIDNIGLTQEQVADRVGKDRTSISNSTRLLRLAGDVQNWVAEGLLSAGHGRALLSSDDPLVQCDVGRAAIDLGLSVRDTERAVKRALRGGRAVVHAAEAREPDANVKAAETRLMRTLNTGVKIIPGKKGIGGKIEIEYYSTDDLDRIYQVIINK
jgi:ParB family chromosome partitioning protein